MVPCILSTSICACLAPRFPPRHVQRWVSTAQSVELTADRCVPSAHRMPCNIEFVLPSRSGTISLLTVTSVESRHPHRRRGGQSLPSRVSCAFSAMLSHAISAVCTHTGSLGQFHHIWCLVHSVRNHSLTSWVSAHSIGGNLQSTLFCHETRATVEVHRYFSEGDH